LMLPYKLGGTAKLKIGLPSAAIFEDAYLDGNKAKFAMDFPLMARLGVEVRPVPYLRVEGAFVWEQWSRQKSISLKPSEPIFMRNVTGITDYQIGDVEIDRNMRDIWSLRGGLELFVPDSWQPAIFRQFKSAVRVGVTYEKGAFSKSAMTPLTLDSDKWVLSAGNSFNFLTERLRLDGVIGYMFMADPKVRNSNILQPSSIRPAPEDRTALGNGDYKMGALYIGGGMNILLK
jgi:long-subunit fatty acid transport protein